jgi:predicted ArsR family transcriptional regulator
VVHEHAGGRRPKLEALALAGHHIGERDVWRDERWGSYLHHKPSPSEPTDDQTTVKRVIELLNEQGFDAEADGTTVCMHRCPFNDLARTNPELICTLHYGIVDGALKDAGSSLRVTAIHPFAEPTLCTATLEPAA